LQRLNLAEKFLQIASYRRFRDPELDGCAMHRFAVPVRGP
jgi:hypothetical protein